VSSLSVFDLRAFTLIVEGTQYTFGVMAAI
jgi:hypothetical protein